MVSQHSASYAKLYVTYGVSTTKNSYLKNGQPSSCEEAADEIQLLQDLALCLDTIPGRLGGAVEEERHDQGDEGCSDGDGANVSPR